MQEANKNVQVFAAHAGDPRCEKEIAFNNLAGHVKQVHDNVRKQCPFCPKHFPLSKLKTHIREVHENVRKPCPFCPKMFPATGVSIIPVRNRNHPM